MLRYRIVIIYLSFTLISYSQVKIVDFLPKDYVRDATKDYTEYLQEVLDKNDDVIFPGFPIMINDQGLKLKSNTKIDFEDGGEVRLKASDKTHYAIFLIEDVDNITLNNIVLVGDKDVHIGMKGEWGMGVYIKGGYNIKINNSKISNCWGDGIGIVRSKIRNSENIEIDNVFLDFNRRNGLTIGSGEDISINNLNISNSSGTLPMAGICIEPNNNLDVIERVVIKNVKTTNNNIGISLGFMNYPSSKEKSISIDISNLISKGDSIGVLYGDYRRNYDQGFKKLKGYIHLRNLQIIDFIKESIKLYSPYGYEFSPNVLFEDISINSKKYINQNNEWNRLKKYKIKNIEIKDIKKN